MQTLTYGHKKPEDGDIGFWDELAANIVIDDAHTHDGVTSAPLIPTSVGVVTQAISNAGWGSVSAGIYSQLVTMTSPNTYDNVSISFRDGTTKEILYLRCVRASSNTYTLYSNDNTLTVSAVYK